MITKNNKDNGNLMNDNNSNTNYAITNDNEIDHDSKMTVTTRPSKY